MSTAPSPTPLTAPSPNRIAFFAGPRVGDDGEVLVALVDVGAQHGDPLPARLGDELDDGVGVVRVARQQRREELDRVVVLQVRGLVRQHPVRRRVAAVEAVARELLHQIEDALCDLGIDLLLLGALQEAGLLLGHDLRLLLAHRAAKKIGAAQRVPRQRRRDLHDLLLIDDDAVGVLQDGLEQRVVVLHLLAPVLALDEVVDHAALQRPGSIQRARGDDVLEAVGLQLLQQLAEAARLQLEHAGHVGQRRSSCTRRRPRCRSPTDRAAPRRGSPCRRLIRSSAVWMTVSVFRPEEVELDQARLLDAVLVVLGDDAVPRPPAGSTGRTPTAAARR